MATWPAKTNYATGDVLTATQMNDIGDELNDLYTNPPAASNSFYAGKNKIINGDFGVWQRGTSFSPTSSTGTIYSADRWANYNNGTGAITVSQQTFTAGTAPVSGYEATYFHRTTFPASLGTTSVYLVEQRIEDVRKFAGQTVTLSFWAKLGSSQATPFNFLRASQNFGSGGSATVDNNFTTPSLTTSWARYSVTLAIPSIAGKTIGSGSYLSILFALNAQASQTFDLWGVQLEAGSTATPFQTATGTIQGELAACQRYYYRTNPLTQAYADIVQGQAAGTTDVRFILRMPTTMRTTPTAVEYSTLRCSDYVNNLTVSSLNGSLYTPDSVELQATVTGATQFRPYILQANNSTSAYIGVTAEL